ncbi:hypothetical protein [Lysobacter sp. CA199]|uniref:hypothetical protein n=1 Tax=Lysobacter sp. CA199 TaxID=3455608 RepID=UPI003F8D8014
MNRTTALLVSLLAAGTFAIGGANARDRAFVLYNNTKYTDLADRNLAIPRSNLVGEPHLPELRNGVMPDEQRFKDAVKANLSNPGPLVLDFEHINLSRDPELSARNLDKLKTLAKWAREAAPGRKIGYYGFPGAISARDPERAKQLAPSVDLFFPSLYTVDDDREKWTRRMNNMVAAAKKIDASKPVLAFIWPQYHDITPRSAEFLPADYWQFQLDQLKRATDGAVIWSKRIEGGDRDWIPVTRSFIEKTQSAAPKR